MIVKRKVETKKIQCRIHAKRILRKMVFHRKSGMEAKENVDILKKKIPPVSRLGGIFSTKI